MAKKEYIHVSGNHSHIPPHVYSRFMDVWHGSPEVPVREGSVLLSRDPEPCRIWTGVTNKARKDYGQVHYRWKSAWGQQYRTTAYAHVLAYRIFVLNGGAFRAMTEWGRSTVVMHLCGNNRCVNPRHLVQATQRANVLHANLQRYLRGLKLWDLTKEDILDVWVERDCILEEILEASHADVADYE